MLDESPSIFEKEPRIQQHQEQAARDPNDAQNTMPNATDEECVEYHLGFFELMDQREADRHRSDPGWRPLSPRTLRQQRADDCEAFFNQNLHSPEVEE